MHKSFLYGDSSQAVPSDSKDNELISVMPLSEKV